MFNLNDLLFVAGCSCIGYAAYEVNPLLSYFIIGGILIVISLARAVAERKSEQ